MRIRSFSSRSSWNLNFFPKNNEDSEVYNDFQPLQTNESVRISREKASNQEESKTVQNRTDSTNPHGSPVFIWILASEPWLETRIKAFKPRFFCFWVDSSKLGFRVHEWENGARTREEERETIQEIMPAGLNNPYIRSWTGLTHTRSTSSWSWPFDQILMDLDQSNAPGALAWPGSIRYMGLDL